MDLIDFAAKEELELIEENTVLENSNVQDLKDLIIKYLSGRDVNLFKEIKHLNIEINIKEKFHSSFSQNVINNILSLKRGETTSYSEIGRDINSKAYQAIGTVLKNNPVPLIIPCHRVIKKSGNIGGFMGETNSSWQLNLKKDLLKIESLKDL